MQDHTPDYADTMLENIRIDAISKRRPSNLSMEQVNFMYVRSKRFSAIQRMNDGLRASARLAWVLVFVLIVMLLFLLFFCH